MIYIVFSDRFLKSYDKLTKIEQTKVDKKIEYFKNDIFHPSLRTHRLQGYLNRFESSVNMDIRIIWKFEGDDVVAFLDVGHHDILKEY